MIENEFIIASGFGEKSQWYKNLMGCPKTTIYSGWNKINVMASRIPLSEAEKEMVIYGTRNPRAAKMVAGLIGYEHEGSERDLKELSKIVPLIRLVPTL